MTNAQHTPGPWHYEADHQGGLPARYTIHRLSGHSVANCFGDKANARLIAATPDMLAELKSSAVALRNVADRVEAHGLKHLAIDLRCRAERQEAVIAKAKGE